MQLNESEIELYLKVSWRIGNLDVPDELVSPSSERLRAAVGEIVSHEPFWVLIQCPIVAAVLYACPMPIYWAGQGVDELSFCVLCEIKNH